MEDESRNFVNEFPDFKTGDEVPYDISTNQIDPAWGDILKKVIDRHLVRLEKNLVRNLEWKDYSVYTGTAGIALLYLYLANENSGTAREDFLKKSLSFVEPSLKCLKGHHLSFLCGDPGPLAVAAVAYHQLGLKSKSDAMLEKLQSLHELGVADLHSDLPDELLYGRAGYLYSILFVQKYIAEDCFDPAIRKSVIDAIIQSGLQLAKKEKWKCPLMYKWHDSYYLGAAHGVSGILYMLMQVSDLLTPDEKNKILKPTIDFMFTLKYPSGNYPSSIGSKSDRLIHWCHGAPGFIHMFAMAFKVFGDEKYLHEALSCGDVIWKRGLLRKGYGLCHGTAGNAFAFLLLYKITNDCKHLYRASKFAEWCFEMETRKCRTLDRPLSLMEGLAGTIYFLASMQNIESAAFPAFQLC